MTCDDWRTWASADVAPLLADEMQAWCRDLDWDVREAWRVVEPARRAGSLPGFVVRDASGRPRGWTSFLLHRNALQVLAFVASEAPVASRLVDAILASPEASRADTVIFCVRGAAPSLAHILAARDFAIDPYRYLRLDLDAYRPSPMPADVRPWEDDVRGFVALCARAYAGSAGLRAFAPTGSIDEWTDYVQGLLGGPGCGWFRPRLSGVVPDPRSGALVGAVFATDLGLSTAHVAQIVVDPASRGRGIGQRLMCATAAAAQAQGYARVTLLVAGSNASALAMYSRLGFADRSAFVVATRRQPSLLTSDACASGGASTRR